MNEDKIIIEWFEKQISNEGLRNIFCEIDVYSSWIKGDDNILDYTKAIRQDFTISRENLFY